MSAKLILRSHLWAQHASTRARGLAFDASGKMLSANDLAVLFDGLSDRNAWLESARALNGAFAVVKVDGTEVHACVDRVRSLPLFFGKGRDGLIVADNAEVVDADLPNRTLNTISSSEFRLTGYVTGILTLIDGLYQIRAGHCFFHSSGEELSQGQQCYYEFRHHTFFPQDDEMLIQMLVEIHRGVFQRLLRSVGDRQVVIPLSGGYDSRLIGVMLRDLGCRNVLCYSYGVDGNWEAKISRELAAYLGFRWTMVPYSGQQWRSWEATLDFRRYFREAGNLAAIPHVQDWPAVYELQRRGELSNDAVFVPGHSGDFLAGSHIPPWYVGHPQITRDEILQSILTAHYSLWDWPPGGGDRLRDAFVQRIDKICGPITDGTAEEAADQFECWDCHERQAKFIVNSVRVYESLGYEWRLPLFDAELMDFWSSVPLSGRVGRRLYFEFARGHQALPITPANADRPILVARAILALKRTGLWPYAKRAQRTLRRLQWRTQYDGADGIGWFALVDRARFRALYTGREIGHSFFALKYLDAIGLSSAIEDGA
jgi:asparagine synthase (glutamine-hydrolysing)